MAENRIIFKKENVTKVSEGVSYARIWRKSVVG